MPSARLPRRRIAVAAVAVAATACRDPLTPPDLQGRSYALRSAGKAPLPLMLAASDGDTTWLLGDTVTFLQAPKAVHVWAYHYAFRESPHDATFRLDVEYRLSGSRVEVGWFTPCPPTALCAGNLVGEIGAAAILVNLEPPARPSGVWRYGLVGR